MQDLLTPGIDPDPVEVMNRESRVPLLLVCEHAGQEIPTKLDNLGLPERERGLHIAYDIGAELVARDVAERFDCTLILQRYSRLVIDCNRRPGTPNSIPEISDSVPVPGNKMLSARGREQREASIFRPYAQTCKSEIAHPNIAFAFSIHSFTPEMAGVKRPWDIAFLYRHQSSQGERLVALCHDLWPDLTIGNNEPYYIDEITDWFIPACAEPRNIPHCLIEVRNDHLRTPEGCSIWADRLYQLISKFMEQTNAPHP